MNPLPKVLLLQNSSIATSKGGIEYYLENFKAVLHEVCGEKGFQVLTHTATSKNFILRPLQNRYSVEFFREASAAISSLHADLILVNHVHLAPLAYVLSVKYQIPYGVIVHGIEVWGNMLPHDQYALNHANILIATGSTTQHILNRPHIFVVHPYLSEEFLKLPEKRVKASKPLRMLTVGRMDPNEQYKGHDHALIALEKVVNEIDIDVKYQIVGTGEDQERLQNLVMDLRLQKFVQFCGRVDTHADLLRFYQEADLYCMPARFGFWEGRWRGEGLGLVYLEAASAGLPVLAYNCGGVKDVIQNERNGILVEPDNIDQLADGLKRLLVNQSLRRQLGEEAYHSVRKTFTLENSVEQLKTALKLSRETGLGSQFL